MMKRKAPWIAVIPFLAFSAGVLATENDALGTDTSEAEQTLAGASVAPGPQAREYDPEMREPGSPPSSDSAPSSSREIPASDSGASSSHETRGTSSTSSSAGSEMTAASFAQADRDSNGALDPVEANAAGINFASANQDDDGVISMREYNFAIAQMGLEPAGS